MIRIKASPDCTFHLEMVELAMDLIHVLITPFDASDKDRVCVTMLSIRVFNGLAAAIKLSLSGYYQSAASQLRDVLETSFILDYFTTDPAAIADWRTLPEKDHRKKFSPFEIRKALDKRDKISKSNRDEAYTMFSRLAAHPTPAGTAMIMPVRGAGIMHCGPFLENEGLTSVLSEMALCAVEAGIFVRRLLGCYNNLEQLRVSIQFNEAHGRWFEQFFAVPVDHDNLELMKQMLAEAEERGHI